LYWTKNSSRKTALHRKRENFAAVFSLICAPLGCFSAAGKAPAAEKAKTGSFEGPPVFARLERKEEAFPALQEETGERIELS